MTRSNFQEKELSRKGCVLAEKNNAYLSNGRAITVLIGPNVNRLLNGL